MQSQWDVQSQDNIRTTERESKPNLTASSIHTQRPTPYQPSCLLASCCTSLLLSKTSPYSSFIPRLVYSRPPKGVLTEVPLFPRQCDFSFLLSEGTKEKQLTDVKLTSASKSAGEVFVALIGHNCIPQAERS